MINVGIAGIGFMGWIHYLAYQKVKGIRLVAIATRDAKKLAGDWRAIQGNFGPSGTVVDVSNLSCYSDYEEMLDDSSIDLIDVCLPPDMHAAASIAALRKGKHVFCEKPMALTVAECRRMVAAARRADRQLSIGHVLPMFPEYACAIKLIRGGRLGKLLGGSFKRVISDPLWLNDFYDPTRVGGPLVDLHVHDAHLIRMLFGMPTAVSSQGRMRGEVVEYCNTQFYFDHDPSWVVSAASGVIQQQGRPFTHGFEIHLEKGTLLYESAVIDGAGQTLMPLTLLGAKGKVEHPRVVGGDPVDAFVAEVREVSRSIKSGSPSAILSSDLARDAIVLCHKQTESVRKRKMVKV